MIKKDGNDPMISFGKKRVSFNIDDIFVFILFLFLNFYIIYYICFISIIIIY